MTKVIKALHHDDLARGKTRFFCDYSVFDERLEKIKKTIAEIADTHNGFSVTMYNMNIKFRYIGFVYGDSWRVGVWVNNVPTRHYDDTEAFLDDICKCVLGECDLFIKAV